MTSATWKSSAAVALCLAAAIGAGACRRGGSEASATNPPAASGETPANNPNNATAVAPTLAPVAPTAPAAPAPTANGPRSEMTGEHHVLTATLAPPGAVPGDGNLTVEVHGAAGYHVNNLYPVALELQATNATAPAQLRRADAAEVSQQVASFHVPVHVTGGGATVTGTMRFAVCSEQNCVPQTQAFAVNLPQ